jgi:hypothetical protein
VDSLGIRLVGNEWVTGWTLLRTTRCKRGALVIWTNTSGETLAVRYKLGKAIEQPCSDVLAHTPEVCNGSQKFEGCSISKEELCG